MKELTFYNLDCGVHYWYIQGQENKWVIFFHGAGLDHNMFKAQLKVVPASYNVILLDVRGHGASKLKNGRKFVMEDVISDVKKLYEVNNIDKAILIGQSMGGNLAQEIVYRYPNMVYGLILIDCSQNTAKLKTIEKLSLKTSGILFKLYPWKLLIKASSLASGNEASTKDYIVECFKNISKGQFIDIMTELIKCLHEDCKFKMSVPVLLICGEDDRLGNIKKIMRKWEREDSNCTLKIIAKDRKSVV